MLHRVRSGAAIASVVVLLALTAARDAEGVTGFQAGDFVTHLQSDWGGIPNGGNAASLLAAEFHSVYVLTPPKVGDDAGFVMVFTTVSAISGYLPAAGSPGALTSSLLNPPSSPAGLLGGETLGLKLNVDFADAGLLPGNLGVPFGDLRLTGFDDLPSLNGLSVREFLAVSNTALGGGSTPYTFADLSAIALNLNDSFLPASSSLPGPSEWAQEHLTLPGDPPPPGEAAVPEPAAGVLGLMSLLGAGLGLTRRRSA